MSAVARPPEAPATEAIKPRGKKRTVAEGPAQKHEVVVRRQGGAKVIAIPPALLASLGADAGTRLRVDVRRGKLMAEPVAAEPARAPSRRYTLDELLQGAEHLPALYASASGALDGDPVGNEIG